MRKGKLMSDKKIERKSLGSQPTLEGLQLKKCRQFVVLHFISM